MHRHTLAALLALAAAPTVAFAAGAPAVDAVDAFFDICIRPVDRHGVFLAAAIRAGNATESSRDRDVFALGDAGTLTVYWDTTCRIDVPVVDIAAALANFDATLATHTRKRVPGPDRDPLPGTTMIRNIVLAPDRYEPPIHLVLLSSQSAATPATLTLIGLWEPPPQPPPPPGYPPNKPMQPPALDPGPNQIPERGVSLDISGADMKPPRYPRAMVKGCAQGVTRLVVSVDTRGRVLAVRVVGSSGFPELDAAAIEAARGWRFQPGMLNGQPMGGDVIVPVNFPNPC